MKNLSLVYGLRLVPKESLKSTRNGEAILKDGSEKHVTLHVIEGSVEQIKNQFQHSVDAFFELLPAEYGEENPRQKPDGDPYSEI